MREDQEIFGDRRTQAPSSDDGFHTAKRAKRATAKASRTTDWSGLRRRTPGAIRKGIAADADARARDAAFWKSAQVVLPTPKELVTMRLDADLLRWFRRERGYQTRINAILRAYMQAHQS